MYSYQRIEKIKNELIELIKSLNEKDSDYNILSEVEIESFKNSILEYDTVLNTIGKNGICKDIGLNKGFKVTEDFVKKIKLALK